MTLQEDVVIGYIKSSNNLYACSNHLHNLKHILRRPVWLASCWGKLWSLVWLQNISVSSLNNNNDDDVDSRHEMAPLTRCTMLLTLATYLLVTATSSRSIPVPAVTKVWTTCNACGHPLTVRHILGHFIFP